MADDPAPSNIEQQLAQLSPTDPIFFLRSPVFLAIVVAIVSHLLKLFGKHIDDSVITGAVQTVLELITLGALGFAAYKRWRSSIAPLTVKSTQKAQQPETTK